MSHQNHLSHAILFLVCLVSLVFLYDLANDDAGSEKYEPEKRVSRNERWDLMGYWTDLPRLEGKWIDISETQSGKHLKKADKGNNHDLRNGKAVKPSSVENHSKWLMKITNAKKSVADKIVRTTRNYKHGDLLLAMITIESDARPGLKYANNYGLCQVSTVHFAKEEQQRVKKMGFKSISDCGVHSPSDLFNIDKNICAANAIFERILKECDGNYARALKKYNANPRIRERYSRRVMERYRQIRKIGLNST